MIKTEYPYIDFEGKERTDLVRTYSDAGNYILQNETGIKYAEAVDVYPCRYTYTETDEAVPVPEPMPEDVVDAEPLNEEPDYKALYEELLAKQNKE